MRAFEPGAWQITLTTPSRMNRMVCECTLVNPYKHVPVHCVGLPWLQSSVFAIAISMRTFRTAPGIKSTEGTIAHYASKESEDISCLDVRLLKHFALRNSAQHAALLSSR